MYMVHGFFYDDDMRKIVPSKHKTCGGVQTIYGFFASEEEADARIEELHELLDNDPVLIGAELDVDVWEIDFNFSDAQKNAETWLMLACS